MKDVINSIKKHIKLRLNQKEWRKQNTHNFTKAINIFPLNKVSVGKKTYGSLKVISYAHPDERLIIGSYCSIADDVEFLLGGEHHPEFLLNFPMKQYYSPENDIDDRRTKGPIVIEDDVWIGKGALILSGIRIGQGAIVAANSVVTKDVPPYAIYTTNKIIRYRFSQEIIQQLLNLDLSKFEFNASEEDIELFYSDNIEEVLKAPMIKRIEVKKGEIKS